MDPFRFVADGVVSSAPLRRPAELTHYYGFALSRSRFAYYGFALSRSRFAAVCAASVASRHFSDGAATPLRGGEYDAFKFRSPDRRQVKLLHG